MGCLKILIGFFMIPFVFLFHNSAQAERPVDQPMVMVTTVDYTKSNGCWATLYDSEGFIGEALYVMGNTEISELSTVARANWEGVIDSVKVGPKARLVLYGEEDYHDVDQSLMAGAEIADLNDVPIGDDVESLKLACTE